MALDIVILAAGQGTRMKSALPKVLHPVAGQPMIVEVVAIANQLMAQNVVVVVGHGAERVGAVLGNHVAIAHQAEQLGTGHAVLQAEAALSTSKSKTVLVLYGDSPLITARTLERAAAHHEETSAAVTLLSFLPDNPTGYGRIIRDGDGRVQAIVEDRDATAAQKEIRESNSGFMLFDRRWLWKNLPLLQRSAKGEYYLTDMTAAAVAQGLRVEALQIEEREVMGVNDRVQLAAASTLLWQRRREQWMQAGVTMVDPSAVWIESGVTIGVETTLQPGVYLRGNTTIGANCTIGAFSILENAQVSDGQSVAPYTYLSD